MLCCTAAKLKPHWWIQLQIRNILESNIGSLTHPYFWALKNMGIIMSNIRHMAFPNEDKFPATWQYNVTPKQAFIIRDNHRPLMYIYIIINNNNKNNNKNRNLHILMDDVTDPALVTSQTKNTENNWGSGKTGTWAVTKKTATMGIGTAWQSARNWDDASTIQHPYFHCVLKIATRYGPRPRCNADPFCSIFSC